MSALTIREKSYSDYGIADKVDQIKRYCMQNSDESNAILFKCAFEANCMIGADLFYSLSQDVSWERLDAIKYVGYSKVDFYGYRRLCMYLVSQCIQSK